MTTAPPSSVTLPATFWQAAQRGVMGRCPRCGEARLFRKWLKSVDSCPTCRQDWTHQRADDFPAYIAILLTGHVLAPLIIMLSLDFDLGPAAMVALIVPLALVMMLGLLQPAKGGVIAAQWWHGLNGFVKERPPASAGHA
ncbi:DUF983 domain-containing protein [Novosphingobium album (ex Liu et al. 2023)]|uniref:DUF983 domain-containing protein n=1 Tax=Novosphingobium album (ex Liu et al. 2023) TaxID=3031130 RepID=A0ABT5WVJ7_9SPHN|nr:DUF983 domain-containing protein [Novosphingobium album (ex Liu et al. 2023)]MDE8653935.1 DUF983 domain-containing protein [Novosphingobium album (ex Liu et al. 2023)]